VSPPAERHSSYAGQSGVRGGNLDGLCRGVARIWGTIRGRFSDRRMVVPNPRQDPPAQGVYAATVAAGIRSRDSRYSISFCADSSGVSFSVSATKSGFSGIS
jgi:hypothetical protein